MTRIYDESIPIVLKFSCWCKNGIAGFLYNFWKKKYKNYNKEIVNKGRKPRISSAGNGLPISSSICKSTAMM